MTRFKSSPRPDPQVCAAGPTGAGGPCPSVPPRPFSRESREDPTAIENVHTLCRRLGRGHCACAAHGREACRDLTALLARFGSVEAAQEAELQRLERLARNART